MTILQRTGIVELSQFCNQFRTVTWMPCLGWCSWTQRCELGKDNDSSCILRPQQPSGHDRVNIKCVQSVYQQFSALKEPGGDLELLCCTLVKSISSFFPLSSSHKYNFSIPKQSYYHIIHGRRQSSLKFVFLMVTFHPAGFRETSLPRITIGGCRRIDYLMRCLLGPFNQ